MFQLNNNPTSEKKVDDMLLWEIYDQQRQLTGQFFSSDVTLSANVEEVMKLNAKLIDNPGSTLASIHPELQTHMDYDVPKHEKNAIINIDSNELITRISSESRKKLMVFTQQIITQIDIVDLNEDLLFSIFQQSRNKFEITDYKMLNIIVIGVISLVLIHNYWPLPDFAKGRQKF